MDTGLIKHNARLIIEQCEKIEGLRASLNFQKSSDNQFYVRFGTTDELNKICSGLEKELHDAETVLIGMLK